MKNDYGKMDSKSMRILTASFAMMVLSTFAMPLMATNAIAINTTHSVEINQADNLTIKGKIVDETGLGVIGANILEVGTTNGAMSDLDGNFTLTVPANAKLKISYIGYTDQTINVNGQTQFNITLAEDSQALDEVVVIGYGTTTKRKLVGAVSSISSEKLEKTPFNNVTDALQGQVSGLIVQSEGGQPGSVPSVSIRGGGTPLYVIDGVIASEYEFSVLNNNDISSISFLKDASATAVYGSKAGDGIILVKTKQGKKGAPQLRYSNSFQISQATFRPKRVNSATYAQQANDVYMREAGSVLYDEETMDKIINHTDLENYPDNDFVDLALKDFAPTMKHNVSISGGSDHVDYYVSLGYMDQGGIYKQSDISNLKRYNARSNITSHFDKIGLDVGFNMNASLQDIRKPSSSAGNWRSLYVTVLPLQNAYNEDGTYAAGTLNPLPQIDKNGGYYKTRKKYVDTQLSLNWKPKQVEGLSFGLLGSYNDNDYFEKEWDDIAQQYYADGSTYPKPQKPNLTSTSGYGHTLDLQVNANYEHSFGKHTINTTVVYNRRNGGSQWVSGYRRDYLSSSVDQLVAGPSSGQIASGTEAESASQGYVFRAKYDYLARYIIEVSGRYDGNDNFADGHKWGFFPAVSGVWMVSDEPFMKSLQEKNILNSLKIRASYGQTGISGTSRYPYLATYTTASDVNSYTLGDQTVTGFIEGNLVNPDLLSWYTRNSTNIGFDFASMNNKLEGSIDYFYYKTTGFLMSPSSSYYDTLGKSLPQIKSDTEHRRAGYELQLHWKEKRGKLFYAIGGNISYYNQMYATLASENESTLKNPYTRKTQEMDYFGIEDTSSDATVYLSDGLFQDSQDFLNSPRPLASTETQNGDIKYIDANGDGKIDDQDRRRIDNPTSPHLNFGVDFSLSYDAWFMNGLIQGTGARYMYMGTGYAHRNYQTMVTEEMYDCWTPENTDSFFPRCLIGGDENGSNNILLSDYYILNAQYIRLKSLSIGYDLKKHVFKNINFLSDCKLTLSATNLFTISDVTNFFDPESTQAKLDSGNDVKARTGFNYPVQRTYSLGLNLAF